MKTIIVKTYPVYTCKTITANNVERVRYSYNVATAQYTSLDNQSKKINTFGGEMDATTVRYKKILDIFDLAEKHCFGGLVPEEIKLVDLWANAYPDEFSYSLSNCILNCESIRNCILNVLEKPNKGQAEVLGNTNNPRALRAKLNEAAPSYLNISKNYSKDFLDWLPANIKTNFRKIYFELPTFLDYTYKVYNRNGLVEMESHSATKRFYYDLISKIYAFIQDGWGSSETETAEIFNSIDQKFDPLRFLCNFEPKLIALLDKQKNIALAENTKFWDKYLDNYLGWKIKPLTNADEFRKAGDKWHNCLGSWGMNRSMRADDRHTVAVVTAPNGNTFVAGIKLDNKKQYKGYTYIVYDHNKSIENDLRDNFLNFLQNI